jgi:hypothetical protein
VRGISHRTVSPARRSAPHFAVRHGAQLPMPPSSRIARTQPLPPLARTQPLPVLPGTPLPSVTGLPVPPLNSVPVPAPVVGLVGEAPTRLTPRWQSPVLPGTATAVVTAPVAGPATAQVPARDSFTPSMSSRMATISDRSNSPPGGGGAGGPAASACGHMGGGSSGSSSAGACISNGDVARGGPSRGRPPRWMSGAPNGVPSSVLPSPD